MSAKKNVKQIWKLIFFFVIIRKKIHRRNVNKNDDKIDKNEKKTNKFIDW